LIEAKPAQRTALAKALGMSEATLFRPVTPAARPNPAPDRAVASGRSA
jgi:hypothetical protein